MMPAWFLPCRNPAPDASGNLGTGCATGLAFERIG